jgi:hypothetical protein
MTHDFGEAEFAHGVWILYIDEMPGDPDMAPEFVPLADRRFVTVRVRADCASYFGDETDVIGNAITLQHPLEGAVLRVAYRATEEQHRRVDHRALAALCEDAGVHRVYGGFHWEPIRTTRARIDGVDESLSPLDAVAMWCDANDLDDDARRALGTLTRDYLETAART